jgi:hypothetical protein
MARIPIGYHVRRVWKKPPPDGSGICAVAHRLHPTREAAEAELATLLPDLRFEYDVVEAYVTTGEVCSLP